MKVSSHHSILTRAYKALQIIEHAHSVVLQVGVANTNSGFIAIVAIVLHREAKARHFLSLFYVQTLHAARSNA